MRPAHQGCVATIGNFDGVHLGHRTVISQLAGYAQRFALPTTVVLFEPQPLEYFRPDLAPARLTRFREKLEALRCLQVDRLFCLRFDAALAELTAAEFVQRVLVNGLDIRCLVVGDDFRFGKGREGDFEFLVKAGAAHGFEVAHTHTIEVQGERVSSTRIRQALEGADFETAARLLGRPYTMAGKVAHGDKRGRTIGFPTANIFLHRKNTPVKGVCAVQVDGLNEAPVNGVANIGTRPTVDGTRTLLEVHLFEFSRQIYGKHVHVHFLRKLRDEKRFDSFEALKTQIHRDAADARAFFEWMRGGANR